jgi:hypothetical protein
MSNLAWIKIAGAIAFAVIAMVSVYDGFADDMDFPSVMVIVISTAGTVGFTLAVWADRKKP